MWLSLQFVSWMEPVSKQNCNSCLNWCHILKHLADKWKHFFEDMWTCLVLWFFFGSAMFHINHITCIAYILVLRWMGVTLKWPGCLKLHIEAYYWKYKDNTKFSNILRQISGRREKKKEVASSWKFLILENGQLPKENWSNDFCVLRIREATPFTANGAVFSNFV